MLKKVVCLILVSTMLMSMSLCMKVFAGLGPNLLNVSDFETGSNIPTGGSWNLVGGSLAYSTKYAHGGTKSLAATSSAAGGGGYKWTNLPVTAGKTYKYTVWIRIDESSAAAGSVNVNFGYGTNQYTSTSFTLTDGFKKIEKEFTIAAGATVTTNELYVATGGANITYYIDDISFAEVTVDYPAVGTNLITNGNFEQPLTTNPPSVWASVTREITTVAKYVNTGTGALRWQQNATWSGGKWSNLLLQKGKTYKLSAYFRLDEGVAANCANLYFQLNVNGSQVTLCGTGEMTPTDGYKKVEKIITLADTDITSSEFVFNANPVNNAGVTFYVDDISIVQLNVPALTSTSPVNNAQNVSTGTNLQFTFNNNINPTSATIDKVSITGGNAYINTVTVNNNAVTVTFSMPLDTGVTYTVKLSGITDVDGQNVADTTISFTTQGVAEKYPNLVPNGYFENPNIKSPTITTWNANTSDGLPNKGGIIQYSSDYKVSGNYSAKVQQVVPYGSVTVSTGATLEPSVTYNISFKGRLDPNTTAPGQKILLYLSYNIDRDGDGLASTVSETINTKVCQTDNLSVTGDFVTANSLFTVPKGTVLTPAKITIWSENGTVQSAANDYGTFYIDDLIMKKVVEPSFDIGSTSLYEYVNSSWERCDYTVASGQRKFVVENITNTTETNYTINAYMALYKGNQLVDVKMNTLTVPSGTDVSNPKSLSVELTIPTISDTSDYKLKTFVWHNGTMQPMNKPIKILFLGNSITQHDPDASKGWPYNWGMAASSQENDYVHKIIAQASKQAPGLQVKIKNIYDFETRFYEINTIPNYQEYVDFDADIIVITIGANAKNANPEGTGGTVTTEAFTPQHYLDIIDYFNPNHKAKVVVGTTIFTIPEVLTSIQQAAAQRGYPLVAMEDLSDNAYLGYANQSAFPSAVAGVLAHPGDAGMAVMATRLLVPISNYLTKLGAN